MKKNYVFYFSVILLAFSVNRGKAQSSCTGIPSNTIVGVPSVCAGQSALLALTNYNGSGITYQWQSATTSSAGPFMPVTGATNASLIITPTTTVWYNVILTCTNSAASFTTSALQVTINTQGVITSTVPYFEGFNSLAYNNQLPNCSWASSNLATAMTFTSGSPFSGTGLAAFYYNPAGTTYFYTNGIQLNAGVTYSTSLFYSTASTSYTNWTDLSIMVGPNQSTTGLVSIVSTGGPALAQNYTALSNTFSVATSGLYYIAIRGTNNGSGNAQFLMWDDLSVTIPCTVSPNSPTVTIASSSGTTLCQGQQATLTASGGDTYLWYNGATTFSTISSPVVTSAYSVAVTKTLTGCTSSATYTFNVHLSPNIWIFVPLVVCAGKAAIINPTGGANYTLFPGNTTVTPFTVTPSVTTTYTIIAMNSYSCSGKSVTTVIVNPLPVITVAGSQTLCENEQSSLTASGAMSYTWSNGTNMIQGNLMTVVVPSSTTYTLWGMDANGCYANIPVNLIANACTGITEGATGDFNIYPNPNPGILNIETKNSPYNLTLMDITGRIIFEKTIDLDKTQLQIENLEKGVYYIKLSSGSNSQIKSILKE